MLYIYYTKFSRSLYLIATPVIPTPPPVRLQAPTPTYTHKHYPGGGSTRARRSGIPPTTPPLVIACLGERSGEPTPPAQDTVTGITLEGGARSRIGTPDPEQCYLGTTYPPLPSPPPLTKKYHAEGSQGGNNAVTPAAHSLQA